VPKDKTNVDYGTSPEDVIRPDYSATSRTNQSDAREVIFTGSGS